MDKLKRKKMISIILFILYVVMLIAILFLILFGFIKSRLFVLLIVIVITGFGCKTYLYMYKITNKVEEYILDNNFILEKCDGFPQPLLINFGNFNKNTKVASKLKNDKYILYSTFTTIEVGMNVNNYNYSYTYEFNLDREVDKTIISYKNNYFIKDRNNKIDSSDSEFNNSFDIFSKDELDLELINLLKEIKKYIFDDFVIYMEKNKLYIIMFTRMDYLGLIKKSNINSIDKIKNKYSRELELIMKIYDNINK